MACAAAEGGGGEGKGRRGPCEALEGGRSEQRMSNEASDVATTDLTLCSPLWCRTLKISFIPHVRRSIDDLTENIELKLLCHSLDLR